MPNYFRPDLEFIAGVGACTEMGKVWDETRLYFTNPQHRRWLRRRVNLRISAHKLINVAVLHLPPATSGRAAGNFYE